MKARVVLTKKKVAGLAILQSLPKYLDTLNTMLQKFGITIAQACVELQNFYIHVSIKTLHYINRYKLNYNWTKNILPKVLNRCQSSPGSNEVTAAPGK